MSEQHSLDFGDWNVTRRASIAEAQREPETRLPPLHTESPRPSRTPDPRVPESQQVVAAVFGDVSERIFAVRYWDGTFEPAGKVSTPEFTISFRRPGSLRRMLLPPSELSIVEAFISGDFDIEGRMESAIYLGDAIGNRLQSPAEFARLLGKLVALPNDPSTAPQELKGTRFERGLARIFRSRRPGGEKAIQYHYDVGNEFYKLWLDPLMVYTCAYFRRADYSLAEAQLAKLDHICRKLRLEPGMRFLDVGCGWGALIMHAAQNYGVDAVGITLSEAQAALGRQRIAAAGLSDKCTIELRDYRDLGKTPEFDRAASVGMMEHVRADLQDGYFDSVYRVLKPGGLFMNHTIVRVGRPRSETMVDRLKDWLWRRDVFIDKYVFPDGRLVQLSHVVKSAESVGFELRDIESLREHYAMTLRHWIDGLEAHANEAIMISGERIYRVWRLYMSAAAHGFASGRMNLVQALLVKPDREGRSEMPLTREYMYSDRSPLTVSSATAA